MAGLVAGTVRAVTSTSQILAGACELSRSLVDLLKPSSRFGPDEAHYIFCIQRQIDCLIGPLELCMSRGHHRNPLAQRTINVVEDTLRRVINCIQKIETMSLSSQRTDSRTTKNKNSSHAQAKTSYSSSVATGQSSTLMLLRRCLDELDIAVSQLILTLTTLQLSGTSRKPGVLELDQKYSILGPNNSGNLSVSTLLKAARRIWVMENKFGDLCLQSGRLYLRQCIFQSQEANSCCGVKWTLLMPRCFLRISKKADGQILLFFENSDSLPYEKSISVNHQEQHHCNHALTQNCQNHYRHPVDLDYCVIHDSDDVDYATSMFYERPPIPTVQARRVISQKTSSLDYAVAVTPPRLKFSSTVTMAMQLSFDDGYQELTNQKGVSNMINLEDVYKEMSGSGGNKFNDDFEGGEKNQKIYEENDTENDTETETNTDHHSQNSNQLLQRDTTESSVPDQMNEKFLNTSSFPDVNRIPPNNGYIHSCQYSTCVNDAPVTQLANKTLNGEISENQHYLHNNTNYLSQSFFTKPYIVWPLRDQAKNKNLFKIDVNFSRHTIKNNMHPETSLILDNITLEWLQLLSKDKLKPHTCKAYPPEPIFAFDFYDDSQLTHNDNLGLSNSTFLASSKYYLSSRNNQLCHSNLTPLELLYIARLSHSHNDIFKMVTTPDFGISQGTDMKNKEKQIKTDLDKRLSSEAHLLKSMLEIHPANVRKSDQILLNVLSDCFTHNAQYSSVLDD